MLNKTAVCDIESCNWTQFACVGFFDGEEYKVFWSVEGLLDHFLTPKYKGWKLYAHFGGKFDFRFFIPVLVESGKYDIRFLERGSRLMSITIRTNNKAGKKSVWKLLDSFFLLPASLATLGKSFGIKYMKKEVDYEKFKKVEDWQDKEAQEYLQYDVMGLYEILEKFSNWGLNGGKLRLTLPSQSLQIYTEKFQDSSMMPLGEEDEDFIRKGYFGGRVEIFKMYGKNLNYYDVNSLYPYCMLQEMPCGRPIHVKDRVKDLIGFYEIEADVPEDCHIPPLPCIKHGKLFFCTGKAVYNTTEAELKLLDKMSIPFKVNKGIVFSARGKIFKKYIEKMYEIRQNFPRGTLDNYVAKLLMNALYGKFAQKRENEELIFSTELQQGLKIYDEEFCLYTKYSISRSRFILPYLSSYITSLARGHLYQLFHNVNFNNVYYCDTDSIITSEKLKESNALGGLKKEYSIKEAVFLQPKAYALKLHDGSEVIKVKGMKELNGISFDTFKKALDTGNMELIRTKYFNILGFRECLVRERSLKIHRREVHKKLNSLYDKRIVLKNHLTKPFNYANII